MRLCPDWREDRLTAEYRSAAGLIKRLWKYEGDEWVWHLTILDGASATVTLSGASESKEY